MKRVKLESVMLGGFLVVYYQGDRGDTFAFGPREPMKREHAAHREICVAGSKRIVKAPAGAASFPLVRAGDNSDARPDLEAGEYVFECLEDGTKCVSICASETPAFSSRWVDLARGESLIVKAGSVAALSGAYELGRGASRQGLSRFYARSGDVTLTATTRVLGVVLWPA